VNSWVTIHTLLFFLPVQGRNTGSFACWACSPLSNYTRRPSSIWLVYVILSLRITGIAFLKWVNVNNMTLRKQGHGQSLRSRLGSKGVVSQGGRDVEFKYHVVHRSGGSGQDLNLSSWWWAWGCCPVARSCVGSLLLCVAGQGWQRLTDILVAVMLPGACQCVMLTFPQVYKEEG
jgi:hypothetical protein